VIFVYRILFLPLALALLPYYLYTRRRRRHLWQGLADRLGLGLRLRPRDLSQAVCPPGASVGEPLSPAFRKCRLWVQAISVGELQALRPLLEHWLSSPHYEVVLTATTPAAYAVACAQYGSRALGVGFWGLDWWLFRRWQFRRLDPDALVLCEADWWPELLHQARQRGVPVALLNARVSPASFRRFYPFRALTRRILSQLSLVASASPLDQQHLLALGAPPHRTQYLGNLKLWASGATGLTAAQRQACRWALGFLPAPDGTEPLVLLGSATWPGEEALLLQVLQQARAQGQPVAILCVPRHPEERRAQLQALGHSCQALGLNWAFHTTGPAAGLDPLRACSPASQEVAFYIVDTVGQLPFFTQLADLAYVGKSLPAHPGGQSPMDAMACGLATVTGPCTANFAQLCQELVAYGALCQSAEPAQELLELIGSPSQRQALASRAAQWYAQRQAGSRGQAVAKLLELIDQMCLY
jgi:3-deoxy-D-manno-octulosonic-acid transferase